MTKCQPSLSNITRMALFINLHPTVVFFIRSQSPFVQLRIEFPNGTGSDIYAMHLESANAIERHLQKTNNKIPVISRQPDGAVHHDFMKHGFRR